MGNRQLDGYFDESLARQLAREISLASEGQMLKVMIVGAAQTQAVYQYNLEAILPPNVQLVHGPGCPSCALPPEQIDKAMALAQREGVIFAGMRDTLSIPGSCGSLLTARAAGADVRAVVSALEALELARQHPTSEVIFWATGFEMDACATARSLLLARGERCFRFSILCHHLLFMSALQAILSLPGLRLDGLLVPVSLSGLIGQRPYYVITQGLQKPVVMADAGPLDIVQAVLMLVRQLQAGRSQLENQSSHNVKPEGDRPALEMIYQTMERRDFFAWRGLEFLPHSALRLRREFAEWDAEVRYRPVEAARNLRAQRCQCGEVLTGMIQPSQCQLFGSLCTPEHPAGGCMTSSHGTCAAFFQYQQASLVGQPVDIPVLSSPVPSRAASKISKR